jgi:hypothetical protein
MGRQSGKGSDSSEQVCCTCDVPHTPTPPHVCPAAPVRSQGVVLASMALGLDPVATAKSKRLGRELTIKVELNGSGSPCGPSGVGGPSCVTLLESGDTYALSWPSLRLLAPTSSRCPVAFKGELCVSCAASGLLLTVNFAKDHSVRGSIEQVDAPPGESPSGRSTVLGSLTGHWTSTVRVSIPSLVGGRPVCTHMR